MLEIVEQMSFTSNLREMIELKYPTFAEWYKKYTLELCIKKYLISVEKSINKKLQDMSIHCYIKHNT